MPGFTSLVSGIGIVDILVSPLYSATEDVPRTLMYVRATVRSDGRDLGRLAADVAGHHTQRRINTGVRMQACMRFHGHSQHTLHTNVGNTQEMLVVGFL